MLIHVTSCLDGGKLHTHTHERVQGALTTRYFDGKFAMVDTLQTDPELLSRLRESAKTPISKQEREQQKISFVYGNLPKGSAITKERVEKRIKEKNG